VFINGLPLAVLELKNPADQHADIWQAFSQIQTYKDEIPDLFVFNEAVVVSDGLVARVGSLTSNKERFLPWRTVTSENDKPLFDYQLETLVKGFFKPDLFLDYIRYFILFEQDGDTIIKKIAGYHQFHAVREAVRATVIAAQRRTARLSGKTAPDMAGKWCRVQVKRVWCGIRKVRASRFLCCVMRRS
jgi:type I restriction enzyme R subunit